MTVIPAAGNLVYDAGGNVHTVYADSTGHYRFDNDSGALIEVHGVANPPGSTNPSDVGTTTNVYDGILPQIHNPDTTLSVGDFVSDTPYYPGKSYRVEINPFTGKLSYFNTDTFNDYSYITEVDLSDLRSAIANVPEDLDGLGFSFDCGNRILIETDAISGFGFSLFDSFKDTLTIVIFLSFSTKDIKIITIFSFVYLCPSSNVQETYV